MVSAATNLEGLRVFVSYPRGGLGHTWAEAVQRHLEQLGADVWRDEDAIHEGEQDWYRRIEQGLETSDVLTCIVGQDTDGCDWQKREMLRAVALHKPIVPLRITTVGLPLYIQEKQPVEARPDEKETLRVLADAVAVAWRTCTARSPDRDESSGEAEISSAPTSMQRQREIAYLEELIHIDYSDREGLYVPLAGSERRSPSLARSMKTVRMDTDAILRAFQMDTENRVAPQEKIYTDALDAYRDLQHRPVRRLAVLGEPGAGKSFSLERIAVEYAQRALHDPRAPVPLLVPLGFWTREPETLEDFIERTLGDVGRHFAALRAAGRVVLLLDAMNEIPPGQRRQKAAQIQRLAEDERFASVIVSCREKDYGADFRLPFDTLTLQPLKPTQILEFLRRALSLIHDRDCSAEAEDRFWLIAGGAELRHVWEVWRQAGADLDLFWMADEVPNANPDARSRTSWQQNEAWRMARFDPRNLIRLASNPYLLKVMTALPQIPANRAQLFQGFLNVLYDRERAAGAARHDLAGVPDLQVWESALVELAAALQRQGGAMSSDGAQTALPRALWPSCVTAALIDYARDASVLELRGDDLRFTHQLLQEYLASRLLLEASRADKHTANDYWPAATWWERSGWEVVAEITAESCGADAQDLPRLITWLAQANPEVACDAWRHVGQPELPQAVLAGIADRWLTRMTDVEQEPHPHARATIGHALGRWGLDRRRGVGIRPDGLPDIDWVRIPGEQPFIYQEGEELQIPTFHIARYPVTNAQFQAFIDADGYGEDAWWQGLAKRIDVPESPEWDEPNGPRETVSWYEAVAFCRWLGERLGYPVTLPTEQQWERAARGTDGREYPWGGGYRAGYANCNETEDDGSPSYDVCRTTVVGLYPQGATTEGVLDLAGNVLEWCLNEFNPQRNPQIGGQASRVLRGGSWYGDPGICRAAYHDDDTPDYRDDRIGFRVCCSAPIE